MTVWRYLNTPSNFNGRDLARLGHIASRVEGAGMNWEAAEIRAFIEKSRPLHTWYGEALNQIGHIAIGRALAVTTVCLWVLTFEAAPYKTLVITGWLAVYLAIEAIVQGWKAGDSWADAFAVALGLSVIIPFDEIRFVDPWHIDLRLNLPALLGIMAGGGLLAFARAWRRFDAKERHT